MNKAKVFNKSTLSVESAELVQCPRCSGFGSKRGDEHGCYLCKGYGSLFRSASGWTRAKYNKLEDSQLW